MRKKTRRKTWGTSGKGNRRFTRGAGKARQVAADRRPKYPARRAVESTGIAVRDLLALANAIYDHVDWVSAKDAGESGRATWELIYDLHQDVDAFKAFQADHAGFAVRCEDEQCANEILLEISDPGGAIDDYRRALIATLDSEDVAGRDFALVCSAVPAYRRKRDRHTSEAHVGSIGDRVPLDLTLKHSTPVPNRFGMSYRLKFYDSQGNELIWFSTKPPQSLRLAFDRPCRLVATIRDHQDYEGSKQTKITRGRVLADA